MSIELKELCIRDYIDMVKESKKAQKSEKKY